MIFTESKRTTSEKIELKNYNFNTKWNYYFHNIKDNNWKLDSYQHIYSFLNINNFWKLYNNHPKHSLGFFFLMRDGIDPIWEDDNNINGGTFSFKISKDQIIKAWLLLSIALVGETITSDSENISGISLHPKYNCYIIKIWYTIPNNEINLNKELIHFNSKSSLYKKNKIEEKSN